MSVQRLESVVQIDAVLQIHNKQLHETRSALMRLAGDLLGCGLSENKGVSAVDDVQPPGQMGVVAVGLGKQHEIIYDINDLVSMLTSGLLGKAPPPVLGADSIHVTNSRAYIERY